MQSLLLDPDVADLAPIGPTLTTYDEEHVVTYIRMLDADQVLALRPVFTFVHLCGTNLSPAAFEHGTFAGREKVANLPIVLIVEDDEAIQSIVEDALKEGGFETAIALSAEEAVTLLKAKAIDYRALVTDINLKGRMNGWEVAKQAREIDPTFPIVYMTGAAANDWASHGVPNSLLLEKPFAPAQVVTAVSQLLNVPPSSQS